MTSSQGGHVAKGFNVRDHSSVHVGDRNTTIVLPTPPPPPRPSPSHTIPFRRDPDFVERNVLTRICQRGLEPAARIALVGLGGVGKSQLAIEYAYRVRDDHPDIWVFWVHATSVARFEESYKKIAERAQLPGWDEPKADTLAMVSRWLSDETNGRWLMVVDNADDGGVLFDPWNGSSAEMTSVGTHRSLSDCLPQSTNGSILVTSRSRDVAYRLTGRSQDIVDVGPSDAEFADFALALLRKKLDQQDCDMPQDDLDRLVRQLDSMPLAITQAAAYIHQGAPRMTVSKYLQILERSDRDRSKLLQKDLGDPRRDGRASNSIIATWHVSFEHIRQTKTSAARLLALMSLFDREAIPASLLNDRYQDDSDDETDFEDDVLTLRNYDLIDEAADSFDMHRLVQFSTKKWLELHGELMYWQERYISILGETFPTAKYTNWPICRLLFPHVEAMMVYRPSSRDSWMTWVGVLHNGASYSFQCGRYVLAESMSRENMQARTRILGPGNIRTLISVGILANTLQAQGKYEEAEEMNRRALAGWEKELGENHPDTLQSVNNLATVLRARGKYEEAEAMNRRALAGWEKELEENHPHTLRSVSNLATVLRDRGKYEEAEAMSRRVLAGWEKELGENHPDTLRSVSNLAAVLGARGKYEEAEEMNRRVLAGWEKVLGENHPDTLRSVSNLAAVLRDRGKYEEAEAMNRRVLAGWEKELGENHPDKLSSASNLATVLRARGKYEEAEAMNRRVLAGWEKGLGENHPDTLRSVNNLSTLLLVRGKYEEAEAMSRRALAGREKELGENHPDTLTSVNNLVIVLQHRGKYEEAEAMNRRALAGWEKELGENHPDTLRSFSNLAAVLWARGKYEEAEAMNRRVLAGWEKELGENHPDALRSFSNLAAVLGARGKYEEAEEMNRRVLAGREKELGENHPDTLQSVYWLARQLHMRQEYHEACASYERAYEGFQAELGTDHPKTIACGQHFTSLLQEMRSVVGSSH